jgi:trehalose synthase
VHEVLVAPADVRALATVAPHDRIKALLSGDAWSSVRGATVINVNSTASGGGVAEMLHVLLPYARGAGVDARWLVIEGDERFFAITKRLHNHLYGVEGDSGALGEEEHRHYESVLRENAAQLASAVRPGDIVVLHDPQPAGLAGAMRQRGARVIWRCHIGTDTTNEHTEEGWEFLRRYLEPPIADAYVFSRRAFAPSWIPETKTHAIPPSIDPFSPKNQELPTEQVRAILGAVGVLAGHDTSAEYRRSDGTIGRIEHGADTLRTGPPPAPDVPTVVQISRWDRLKDMVGVLHGFTEFIIGDGGTQLILAGPVVTAVADDPEGAQVFHECWEAWRHLPHHARRRVALVCLPMGDPDENAIIVNALQRHAAVVTQKSLAEGFGLTVSEAMFKRRTVIGSAVGGIADQIVDGVTGVLLRDPTDLDGFAAALGAVLGDPGRRLVMGERARERVIEQFLPDVQLGRWQRLVADVLSAR